jgi:hypothetical protein
LPRVAALQRRAQLPGGQIARHVVDGLELGPIDGHHRAAEEPQLAAEQVELTEDRLESRRIVLAEIGDRLAVGLQLAQQPEQLERASAFQFQTAAGAHLVEVTPKVELQEIARRERWPAGLRRRGAGKAAGCEIEPFDKGLKEAHRMLRTHIILQAFRQQSSVWERSMPVIKDMAAQPITSRSGRGEFSHSLSL